MTAAPPIFDQLSALADPTRSRILLLLDRHELTVGELCTALRLPQSTVSRHLKILGDEGWVVARAEGTTRRYRMVASRLEAPSRRLWQLVRAQAAELTAAQQDAHRLEAVLAQRRTRMIAYFENAAGHWDRAREEMIGARTDLLALLALLDDRWTVADLGCGTGHVSDALAPCVRRVVAIDESGPMLSAARKRLGAHANVELRPGRLESLPLEDGELDAAVMFLVAQYVADPAQVVAEVARVLRPGGKFVLVDLMPHDREEYVLEMGHVWQGFDEAQTCRWLEDHGFERARYRPLPADPNAQGPALFVASATRLSS
jgi:ArsR family transcriptional regulator